MAKLFHVSVTPDMNLEQTVQTIYRNTRLRNWNVWEGPQPLMGNFKVLRLTAAMNSNIICKVEGPGFIIGELYLAFLRRDLVVY